MSTMNKSSNDVCSISGSGAAAAPSKNVCTSCDQKMKDGVCENNSDVTNTTSSIDTVSDDTNNMTINDDNKTTESSTDSNMSAGTSMSDCYKKVKGAPKSNSTLEVIGQLQNMSTADNNISVCANCGKEGDNVKNICNKCKQVKYCTAACKKKHRHKHKKDCEEHLRQIAEKYDEELFKEPPPKDGDCPICFLRMPSLHTGSTYMACCGKVICNGCVHTPVYDNAGNEVDNEKCPFCRTPWHDTKEQLVERTMKRMEMNDPIAIFNIGCDYRDGTDGYKQDYTKALELYHQAAELGNVKAYCAIGNRYHNGKGVEIDKEKAKHYYELGAMGGDEKARYNLGNEEMRAGNYDRALKHYMIAVKEGYADSLKKIQELYSDGHATKEDYTKALQSYQAYLGEIKSEQRDEAAAADEEYRYH